MSQFNKELRSYTVAELTRRKRRVRIRAGILILLAAALAFVSLYRDDKANIPGLIIAVATLAVSLSALSQGKAINKELVSRKR